MILLILNVNSLDILSALFTFLVKILLFSRRAYDLNIIYQATSFNIAFNAKLLIHTSEWPVIKIQIYFRLI